MNSNKAEALLPLRYAAAAGQVTKPLLKNKWSKNDKVEIHV